MKKAKKKMGDNWPYIIIIIVVGLLILASIIFEIWLFITYKDVPLKDIPYWVLWFLPGRK